MPAGEAAAAATKSILGLRDSAAACEPAPALWAPKWGWQLAQTPIWSWHGAEELITRSPLKANAELVRTAFFWKLLVEDVGQSGWLSNRRTHFREFFCLFPQAQAFDNNFFISIFDYMCTHVSCHLSLPKPQGWMEGWYIHITNEMDSTNGWDRYLLCRVQCTICTTLLQSLHQSYTSDYSKKLYITVK